MKKSGGTDNSFRKYCAFLRGVNVKGTAMKMAEACQVFEQAGVQEVSALLASGNIMFSSPEEPAVLKEILQKALGEYFQYEAFLFVKDQSEIAILCENNPFESHPDFHIYGFVGVEAIAPVLAGEFEKAGKAEGEEGREVEDNFYWKVPKGITLESEFGKILGRKNLKSAFTSRNINTFEKILKKMRGF